MVLLSVPLLCRLAAYIVMLFVFRNVRQRRGSSAVCVVIVPLVIHGIVPSVAGLSGGLADGRGQCERALSSPRRSSSAQSDSLTV